MPAPTPTAVAAVLLLLGSLTACGTVDAGASSSAATDAAAACDQASTDDVEGRIERAARAAEVDPGYRPLHEALLEVQETGEAVSGVHALGPASTPDTRAHEAAVDELRRQCERAAEG